jgi:acyl carrier protein
MEKNEIRRRVQGILINVLELDNFELKENMVASDVPGWDSLNHMIIISKVEKEFNVGFKLRELSKLENLDSLIDLIHQKC